MVAVKNHANGALNPRAQFRQPVSDRIPHLPGLLLAGAVHHRVALGVEAGHQPDHRVEAEAEERDRADDPLRL